METLHVVRALGALAQDSRLAIYRLLVATGPEGLPVGAIADRLELANATLSFHLKELTHAGLTIGNPQGRSIIYSANFETMNQLLGYLTENCCGGNPCTPTKVNCAPGHTPSKRKSKATVTTKG